jgi:EAL domain-containing protein (putative c-di-GMP-specific phosphodiesterase class I)
MAHALGLQVVVEGVETEEQLALLREIGCDLVQGFLLSRPVRAEVLTAMLVAMQAKASLQAPSSQRAGCCTR